MTDIFEQALRTIADGGARNPQKFAEGVLSSTEEGQANHDAHFVKAPVQILERYDSARPNHRWFMVGIDDECAPDGETAKTLTRVLGLAFGDDVSVEALTRG